jgi:hypothetical protein
MVPMVARVILIAVLVTACGERVMVVESDTSWSGSIGNSSRDGYGDQILKMSGSGTWCWSIQKQTRGGYLKAYSRTPSITGTEKSGEAETNAQFGIVTGCSP